MAQGYFDSHGNYTSIHGGTDDPSPALLIVRAARGLILDGAKLHLGAVGLDENSVRSAYMAYGAVGKRQIAAARVEDLITIWEKIKDHPRIGQHLAPYPRPEVEAFISAARQAVKRR